MLFSVFFFPMIFQAENWPHFSVQSTLRDLAFQVLSIVQFLLLGVYFIKTRPYHR